MFKGLSAEPSDIITGIRIPTLKEVPNQAVQILNEYGQEANFNKYESLISSMMSNLYIRYLDWHNVYIMKFPSNYALLPAITTVDKKIILNATLSTANYNLNTNSVTVGDINDFCSAIVYGINYIILESLDNDNVVSEALRAIINFVYSLIGRIYAREIDFTRISNQDIAAMYYGVALACINMYVTLYSGNIKSVAKVLTHNFFSGDVNSRVSYNPGLLPNVDISNYEDLFKYLDESNILPSVSLEDFRNKVVQSLSLTGIICMSNGLSLASMITSCKFSSNVFNSRIEKVKPQSTKNLFSLILQYLTKKVKEEQKQIQDEKNKNTMPSDWGWNING